MLTCFERNTCNFQPFLWDYQSWPRSECLSWIWTCARSWLGRESDVEPTSTRTACKTRKFVARVLLHFFFYIFRVIETDWPMDPSDASWVLVTTLTALDRELLWASQILQGYRIESEYADMSLLMSLLDFQTCRKAFPYSHFQTIGQVARLRRDLQMNAGLPLFFWTIQTRLESFGSALISTLLPCEWNHCDLTYSNSWNRSEAARTPPRNQHRGQHS